MPSIASSFFFKGPFFFYKKEGILAAEKLPWQFTKSFANVSIALQQWLTWLLAIPRDERYHNSKGLIFNSLCFALIRKVEWSKAEDL